MPLEGQVVDSILSTPLQDLVITGQDTQGHSYQAAVEARPTGLAWSVHPVLTRIVGDGMLCHIFYLDRCRHKGTENLCDFKDHILIKVKLLT